MDNKRDRRAIIEQSTQKTEEGQMELYLYSLRKMAEQNVESNRNPVTQLYNLRAYFYLCGEQMRMEPHKKYAVIVMDIAQFKAVNEFCGRAAGDEVLRVIARSMNSIESERQDTFCCHIRADVFSLFTSFDEEEDLVAIVNRIIKDIDDFPIDCKILPAFGICTSEQNGLNVSFLKDCATIALNTVKGKFYANYAFFDEKMRREQLLAKQIENDIVNALKNDQFALYIQPKVDMSNNKIIGGEALVRWIHPEQGMISPGEFIPILEKNGFIINVDDYIWEKVFAFIRDLENSEIEPVPISINVSRVHAYDKNFCKTICELSKKYQVNPAYIPLELTESAFLGDEQIMYSRMEYLRNQGFYISMDDFGTGYSTMKMLKNQPMDEIKIDREFISDLESDMGKVVISHTIRMLQEMNTDIIIEGVETELQKNFLLEHGCNRAQGFLFYKPMPVEEFRSLLLQSVY
ncbi:MAG: EAL domain-containing protein [Lachnospiraceae bacterium]|nr:EAL domain-containing protein [Lachnospiraceae bacterium]